jgi:phage I-like protein
MKMQLALKALDGAPAEFQILPYGHIEIEGDEPAVVGEEAMNAVIAAFARRKNDMVIDYEHQTLKGGQAPAAGWISKLTNKGGKGLWAAVKWTDKAKEYLQNKEYRYFSPVFWVSKKTRQVLAVENIALTNAPKINALKPIIAKYEPEPQGGIMLEKLKQLLGLADDAGEDKVMEAVTAIVAKVQTLEQSAKGQDRQVVACKEVLDALGLSEDADTDKVVAAVSGLKATGTAAEDLSAQVARLQSEIAAMKQNDLVQLALKDGKISPDELEKWGRDLALSHPEQFTKIVLSRPAGSVVPVQPLLQTAQDASKAPDEAVLEVAKFFGNSKEDIQKYAGIGG